MKKHGKVIVLLLTMIMTCTMSWGSGGQGEVTPGAKEGTTEVVFPLEEKITISFMLVEHPTVGRYDFADDGHPGFKWLEEQTNIHLDVTHIPTGNAIAKYNLMISAGELPDLLLTLGSNWTQDDIENFGDKGLIVDVLEYKNLIPNYLKLIEEEANLEMRVNDGKMYGFYLVEKDSAKFTMFLPYRKDLWDKHNLKSDTWDDMHESFKTLKYLYPDSYPIGTFTQGGRNTLLDESTASFRTGGSIYYNIDKKEWVFGPMEDNYKLYLDYFAKFYRDGVLNPSAATMTYEQWQQSWINNETFFAWWWSATGNWFIDNPGNNPDYGPGKHWVEALPVPRLKADGPRGYTANRAPNNVYDPKVISTKSKYIKEIIALMDLLVQEDNVINVHYGPKGEMWDIIDGKYRWLPKEIKTPYNPDGTMTSRELFQQRYNIGREGGHNFPVVTYNAVPRQLNDALNDPDYQQMFAECDMYVEDGSTQLIPQPWTRFSAEDRERVAHLKTILDTYAQEEALKFIFGKKPISEFDNFREELKELNVQDLIDLYKKGSGM